jgi:hypothetical protein
MTCEPELHALLAAEAEQSKQLRFADRKQQCGAVVSKGNDLAKREQSGNEKLRRKGAGRAH